LAIPDLEEREAGVSRNGTTATLHDRTRAANRDGDGDGRDSR
jgi:hypothetical protein